MDNIIKEQAVGIIKEAFELDSFQERKEGKSFYGEDSEDVSFFFDKRQYDRATVIEKLRECFKDKNIVEGQCRIDNITLLYTVVHIEPRGKR